MTYGTVEEANSYHSDAGNAEWTGFEEEARSSALSRATRYIDGVYGNRFSGTPIGSIEEWPRNNSVDRYGIVLANGVIPSQIFAATFTAALYDLQNPNILWKVVDPAEQVKSSKIGPLRKEYFSNQFNRSVVLQSVDAILRGLLTRVNVGPRVVGA